MNHNNTSPYTFVTVLTTYLLLNSVILAAEKPFVPPPPLPDDRSYVPSPDPVDAPNDLEDFFEQQFILQGEQLFDLSRHLRKLVNRPKEAYNVDAFGEVANSSWYTNRNAFRQMTIEEVVRGPVEGDGPDILNKWEIIRAKAEGVTPGFTIVDNRGDTYVIKFDPKGFKGLNSGSDVIGSKLYYAAGYFVPQNYITYFNPSFLELGKKVKFTDEKGRKRHMTPSDLEQILTTLEREDDGTIRALASKYVEGRPLGPFDYHGTRDDDFNDLVPHHHRRELRGLRVLAAWLNHIDSKQANSMDTYYTDEGGNSYVRHYLIDFGTILGSGGRGPQPKYRGHQNELDPQALLWRTLTLGLFIPDWERVPDQVEIPCIGRYYSEDFHPKRFKIIFPNPAFDNLTNLDGYWGAKLVMSFTDEQLRAVVNEAQYPDPMGADRLYNTIRERRDITGRYWFDQVTPLDKLKLLDKAVQEDNKNQVLSFTDLSVESGLESGETTVYRYNIVQGRRLIKPYTEIGNRTSFHLPSGRFALAASDPEWGRQFVVRLQLKRDDSSRWGNWVKVYLEFNRAEDRYELIGIRRQS